MEFDLVVRDGLIVDGTGSGPVRGDVGIVGDRIAVVGEVDGRGHKELDAQGLIVAPGFVDGHTHMDAQVFWDPLGSSSCWHGVTTVVMGNCGFTLAPVRPEERDLVVRNLQRSEDIPLEAMEEGIRWTWSSFSEFLDALDQLPKGINYAGSIGHSALRTWAMGERAFEHTATEDELQAMARELRVALRAGAVGFSTSRSESHAMPDGRPVASRIASWDEVKDLVGVVGQEGTGVFQLAHPHTGGSDAIDRHFQSLQDLSLATGVPAVFGIFPFSRGATLIDDTVAKGGQMYGLTRCRAMYQMQSFKSRLCFDVLPEWQAIRKASLEEQRRLLRHPEIRVRLVEAAHTGVYPQVFGAEAREPNYESLAVMRSAYRPNPTVAAEARTRGVDPVELMIDLGLESDFEQFFVDPLTRNELNDDAIRAFRNPHSAMTFTDAGAHVSQVCDSSMQTHLLAYWVRERQVLTIEEAVRMITSQPAKAFRLRDRGVLAPGYAADVTIFDPDRIEPLMPYIAEDLPGGAQRLIQRAVGYRATVVNGQIFTENGEATEARSGRLIRAGRLSPHLP
jgi:N-acyl-D-aspartate/D-glutamate deacylase